MRIFLKILTSLLLLINGIGALYGGGSLILYPDGSNIQLSLELLKPTPFTNYLIPGIVLFIANGLGSLLVLVKILLDHKDYWLWVIAQGLILSGWIIFQILLIQFVYFLHFVLFAAGIALIVLGWNQKYLK